MAKEARAGLVPVVPVAPRRRLFVTARDQLYEQDSRGRVLLNGFAVSRASLAGYGLPRLLLEGVIQRDESVAFLFVRLLPHGWEATVLVTEPVRILGLSPVMVIGHVATPGWLQLARAGQIRPLVPRPAA